MAKEFGPVYDDEQLEDELYAEQVDLHPEYQAFLASGKDTFVDETGQEVNPRLHLTFHVVLEKQMALGNPLFVRQTVERLEARGLSPHEARHTVLSVFVPLVVNVMKQRKPLDLTRYEKALKRL